VPAGTVFINMRMHELKEVAEVGLSCTNDSFYNAHHIVTSPAMYEYSGPQLIRLLLSEATLSREAIIKKSC
jgi:uncharacterized protein (DUF39 family)